MHPNSTAEMPTPECLRHGWGAEVYSYGVRESCADLLKTARQLACSPTSDTIASMADMSTPECLWHDWGANVYSYQWLA